MHVLVFFESSYESIADLVEEVEACILKERRQLRFDVRRRLLNPLGAQDFNLVEFEQLEQVLLRLRLFHDISEGVHHPVLRQEDVRLLDDFLRWFRGILLRGNILSFFCLLGNMVFEEALESGNIGVRLHNFTEAVEVLAGLGRAADVIDLLEQLQAHSGIERELVELGCIWRERRQGRDTDGTLLDERLIRFEHFLRHGRVFGRNLQLLASFLEHLHNRLLGLVTGEYLRGERRLESV